MKASYQLIQADARHVPLANDSVDLVFGSPPYEAARTYGIGFKLKGQAWADFMVEVFVESLRVCTGLVAFVVEGQTNDFSYSAAPALLMADLARRGVCLRKPAIYSRVGIPGSGGPDFLRNDWEFIVCATRGGKLPWSDNTACGHPPKWAPGGEMSHRRTDGTKVNQWGATASSEGKNCNGTMPAKVKKRPSHKFQTMTSRGADGIRKLAGGRKTGAASGHKNGDVQQDGVYVPPTIANPGNIIHCKVGGNLLGHDLAHENEAPFPLKLADFFIRSFCRPGGKVLDPFIGSGSTCHAAMECGRDSIGLDIRWSQIELAHRRLSGVTRGLFA